MKLSEVISGSPTLFPLNLDPSGSRVQVIRLSEQDYYDASFLDNRLLTHNVQHAVIPWGELEEASSSLPIRCDFIFHISHCGSTLLSRLLGGAPDCFAVREPAILRLLGKGQFLDRSPVLLGLWSRTFHPNQRAVIKATSFVSEIGPQLLSLAPKSRALLIYISAATFLSGLLDGAMTDIQQEASSRLERLQSKGFFLETKVTDLGNGQCVAMSWLSEMISLSAIASSFPEQSLWLDFDRFLEQSEAHLTRCLHHFQLTANAKTLLAGTTMNRYAKKPDVQYDSSFRTKLLEQASKKFQAEIQSGLAWLDQPEALRARQRFNIALD